MGSEDTFELWEMHDNAIFWVAHNTYCKQAFKKEMSEKSNLKNLQWRRFSYDFVLDTLFVLKFSQKLWERKNTAIETQN